MSISVNVRGMFFVLTRIYSELISLGFEFGALTIQTWSVLIFAFCQARMMKMVSVSILDGD